MANNLICNQPCASPCTTSSPSNQAHSAIHSKLINRTSQQGVGRLFVARMVSNFLSQEYILLWPDSGSLKHERTPVRWTFIGTSPATNWENFPTWPIWYTLELLHIDSISQICVTLLWDLCDRTIYSLVVIPFLGIIYRIKQKLSIYLLSLTFQNVNCNS